MKTVDGFDRFQALRRIPQFKEDFNKITASTSSQKAKSKQSFITKYDVTYEVARHLVGENPSLVKEDKSFLDHIFNGDPIEIIPSWMPLEATDTYNSSKSDILDLREGRYFTVKIDLSQNRAKILSRIENQIDFAVTHNEKALKKSQYRAENRGKKRDFQYSIWHVYDLCSQKKKPNFTKVARMLTGRSGQARDDDVLSASLKAVERAYNRAKEIMQEVEETIPKGVDV